MKRLAAGLTGLVFLLFCLGASAQGDSWEQINQPLERPENWRPLVEASPFILGEKTEAGQAGGAPMYLRQWGTYPSLDGSTVCVPLAMELARQLLGMGESDLSGFVSFSTTHYAYERLIGRKPNPTVTIVSENTMMDSSHPVDVMLGTEPSKEELEMAQKAGIALKKVPICCDAFVFLVNAQNPVDNLTLEEIRGIYSGAIRAWSAVGGTEGEIIPFQREANSGSQTAMENLVMKGLALSGAADNYISDGMSELVRQIGSYDNGPNSIGYSYLYYVENLYQSGEVKVISVNGVSPTPENLRSGAYPLTACYYAVYRDGDEGAKNFAQWLAGAEGQKCVKQAGYIPFAAP